MNPRRVTEEHPRSLDAQLLRAGRQLSPPPGQLARTLAALSAFGIPSAQAASLALTIKWAATGLASGVVLVAAVSGARHVWLGQGVASPVEVAQPKSILVAASATLPRVSESVSSELEPKIPVPAAAKTSGVPVSTMTNVAAAVPDSTLGREVALIEQVRSEIGQHRSARALELLDEYARSFPAQRLAEEAAYLRVMALQGTGNAFAAQRAAERFRERFPSSPLSPLPTE
jgi:hypothetical protein